MNLNSLIDAQAGLFAAFFLMTIFFNKFVNYFEIELSVSVFLLTCYFNLGLFGFICRFFVFKQQTTKEGAKRSVSLLAITYHYDQLMSAPCELFVKLSNDPKFVLSFPHPKGLFQSGGNSSDNLGQFSDSRGCVRLRWIGPSQL